MRSGFAANICSGWKFCCGRACLQSIIKYRVAVACSTSWAIVPWNRKFSIDVYTIIYTVIPLAQVLRSTPSALSRYFKYIKPWQTCDFSWVLSCKIFEMAGLTVRRTRSWTEEANRLIAKGEESTASPEVLIASYRKCLQRLTQECEFLNLKVTAIENSNNAEALNTLVAKELQIANDQVSCAEFLLKKKIIIKEYAVLKTKIKFRPVIHPPPPPNGFPPSRSCSCC